MTRVVDNEGEGEREGRILYGKKSRLLKQDMICTCLQVTSFTFGEVITGKVEYTACTAY